MEVKQVAVWDSVEVLERVSVLALVWVMVVVLVG